MMRLIIDIFIGCCIGCMLMLFICMELGCCPFAGGCNPRLSGWGIGCSIVCGILWPLETEHIYESSRHLAASILAIITGSAFPFALQAGLAALS